MAGSKIYCKEVICFEIRRKLCKYKCFSFNLFEKHCFASSTEAIKMVDSRFTMHHMRFDVFSSERTFR